jgi:hypothetical protein
MKRISAEGMKKVILILLCSATLPVWAQSNMVYRDSVVKRIIYRDTIIYKQVFRHDTVRIRHYIFSDTLHESKTPVVQVASEVKKKKLINPNNWGIGPSVGAYYSPINGFDVNIGFGIQYYMLAIPSFRNPHLGHRKKK